jgi:hypothetical protein
LYEVGFEFLFVPSSHVKSAVVLIEKDNIEDIIIVVGGIDTPLQDVSSFSKMNFEVSRGTICPDDLRENLPIRINPTKSTSTTINIPLYLYIPPGFSVYLFL